MATKKNIDVVFFEEYFALSQILPIFATKYTV